MILQAGMPDDQPLDPTLLLRLRRLIQDNGSADVAARRLDIAQRTVRNAAAGRRLRPGTRLLLATQLAALAERGE